MQYMVVNLFKNLLKKFNSFKNGRRLISLKIRVLKGN